MTLGKAQEIGSIWQAGGNSLSPQQDENNKTKRSQHMKSLVFTQSTDLHNLFNSCGSRTEFWMYRAVISAAWETKAGGP